MRWGLVGAGTIARRQTIGALGAAGREIALVVSAPAVRARDFTAQHGIGTATDDLAAMFADPLIRALHVASPSGQHHAQALTLIAVGLACAVRNSAGDDRGSGVRIGPASDLAGAVFATTHHLRGCGSRRMIRSPIQSGRIGRMVSPRLLHAGNLPANLPGWRINDPGAGGGVVPDIPARVADLARFLPGKTRVRGRPECCPRLGPGGQAVSDVGLDHALGRDGAKPRKLYPPLRRIGGGGAWHRKLDLCRGE